MVVIRQYLLLILVCLSLTAYGLAWHLGIQLEFAVLCASIMTLVLAWGLERSIPYREEWLVNQNDLSADLTSAGVLITVVDPLLKATAPLLVVALYSNMSLSPIIEDLALWLQVLLVLTLVELGKYWSHRLHHKWGRLWWLHAMHHSSRRLYFLNGLRFHPVNYALNFAIAVLPVMALGVSPEAILGYLAFSQPIVLLQHANIDLRHGWLNWVFSTPEAHRWHHSTKSSEANCNFGNALLIWDHIFGTFKSAKGFDKTRRVGLFASSNATYPGSRGYFTQVASMLSPSCCRT